MWADGYAMRRTRENPCKADEKKIDGRIIDLQSNGDDDCLCIRGDVSKSLNETLSTLVQQRN